MKRSNFSTAVLFVLVGFCGGVAFNVFPIGAIAQRAPETPPAALKSVTHDSTLAGDGTTAVPLGIANGGVRTGQLANGAVTVAKLSAVAIPTAGQVLGFNGANLAWQNAPVGGVRVVDSLGRVVGPMVIPWSTLGPCCYKWEASCSKSLYIEMDLAMHKEGLCSFTTPRQIVLAPGTCPIAASAWLGPAATLPHSSSIQMIPFK